MYNLRHKKEGLVWMANLNQWDFKQYKGKYGVNANHGHVHDDDLTDLIVKKEGINHFNLVKTSLFNIGGYFHFADGTEDAIYLQDGLFTETKLESNQVGCLSFEEVKGVVKSRKVEQDDLFRVKEDIPLYDEILVKVSDIDLEKENRLVGLVLLGELYWLSGKDEEGNLIDVNFATILSPHVIKIEFRKYGLPFKIHKLRKIFYKLYGKLTPYKQDIIKMSDVINDEKFIKHLFTLPQTFIVMVDTPSELIIKERMVSHTRVPQRYYVTHAVGEPCGFHHQPLRVSDGRYMPYKYHTDKGGVVIATEPNIYIHSQNDQVRDIHELDYLQDIPVSHNKYEPLKAHLLDIYLKDPIVEEEDD